MKIPNLGCGTKVSASPDVVNIDWAIYLRLKKNPALERMARFFLRGEHRARFEALPPNIMVHNLAGTQLCRLFRHLLYFLRCQRVTPVPVFL